MFACSRGSDSSLSTLVSGLGMKDWPLISEGGTSSGDCRGGELHGSLPAEGLLSLASPSQGLV